MTGRPTLMEALKAAVSERHARMERLPFIAALTGGSLPLVSYVGQLRAMAVLHSTLEHELGLAPAAVRSVALGRPSRLAHLRRDLSLVDPLLVPDLKPALAPARALAARIRLWRAERPADLLGVLYVLEGTVLGNAVHLPDALRAFGAQTAGAVHYYAGYGEHTAECWRGFCAAMNAFPLEPDEGQGPVRAALDCFDHLERVLAALYPVEDGATTWSAGMLNPEAGDHAVPGDVRELRAAVAAADRCRGEFPYFDERFRERGRAFARSDAAWLAALAGLPAPQLLGQVEWLGRVLGNRGMPRITLERQLELLYEELAAAAPERAGQYGGLLEAAAGLGRERLQRIPEPVFSQLERAFHRDTGGALGGRFTRTGALIASAACDQAAGISGAVSSLVPWLTDAGRFAPDWIKAVRRTLERALAAVSR